MGAFWKKPKAKVKVLDKKPLVETREAEPTADHSTLIKVGEKVSLNPSQPPASTPVEPSRTTAARDRAEPRKEKETAVKPPPPEPKPTPPELETVTPPATTPLKVFLSYAREDKRYKNKLLNALKVTERKRLIEIWHDGELTAGEKWAARILEELNAADVIVCQLSQDFLASDFCVLTELETAIRRKNAGEAELIAYVLKACSWEEEEVLSQFQILPDGAKTLKKWGDPDEYWKVIAEGIRKSVLKLRQKRASEAGKAGG